MKYIAIIIGLVITFLKVEAQDIHKIEKKVLDPSVYNKWKTLEDQSITKDGKWITYQINPAKGDGFLYIFNTESGKRDSIPRGTNAKFSNDVRFLVFMIEPQYDTVRALKLKKVNQKKLPKDSLGIYFLENDSLVKIPKVKSYQMPDSLNSYILYKSLEEKKFRTCSTRSTGWWIFKKKKTVEKPSGRAPKGENMVLYNPNTGSKILFDFIDEFIISHDGAKIAFIKNNEDSKKPSSEISIYQPETNKKYIIKKEGNAKYINFSYKGDQWAFLFSPDTVEKNKVFSLYYGNNQLKDSCVLIADSNSVFKTINYCPSENYKPYFSHNGQRLFFGIAKIPKQAPKDTLLDEEKYHVDIWSYNDDLLQPEQKRMAAFDKRRTLLCYIDIKSKEIIQLESDQEDNVSLILKGDGKVGLLSNRKKYMKKRSWDGFYTDYYIVNMFDGSKEIVLEDFQGYVGLSNEGNYLLYYNQKDSAWYSYDIKARKHISLTKNLPVNFYDEYNDMPMNPGSYGISGWYLNDKYVIINDQFDLWLIDPTGKNDARNLTNSFGRKNNIRFRAFNMNRENRYFNQENPHYLSSFDKTTKESGYYLLNLEDNKSPEKLIQSEYYYLFPVKAEDANILIWRRMNFEEDPELYVSDMFFKNIRKISNTNPQQAEYNWGTTELTSWTAFDEQKLEGIIYKPENFDSTKKYPMIVYFYERYSDNLFRHYIPKPSYSTINFTEYTSNGYIVFVPDITYKVGHPAKSAYNAIVSGTEFMKKNPWIDSDKIGLQGQSWGGYQTAMLITMTDIYACAEAGAPVSNMTSAYGGIRWGSGMSRAFQYEKTQSRIGYSLWDSMNLYIENSPIFFANKVKTPLMIMHNDKDGAVPWYQGIEYFSALRRLDKPVWMVSYNNDDHNLTKWPNRVDLSIRMMQFYNHYLKDEPMPKWMEEGIPAVNKDAETGYELIEE